MAIWYILGILVVYLFCVAIWYFSSNLLYLHCLSFWSFRVEKNLATLCTGVGTFLQHRARF
jgi:hypothetical protein